MPNNVTFRDASGELKDVSAASPFPVEGAGSSGSSAGGGNNAYYALPSGASGADGISAYSSATTVDVDNLNYLFTKEQIVSIKQIPNAGGTGTQDVTYSDVADFTVTGTSGDQNIEIDGATLAATDTFVVTLIGPDKYASPSLNATRNAVINGEHTQRTGPEHLIDEANEAAATYRTEFPMNEHDCNSIQWNVSGGVTMTIWGTNDDSADTTADTGWADITAQVTGNASEVDNSGMAFMDTKIAVDRIMIKRVTSDSSNASDVFINRAN